MESALLQYYVSSLLQTLEEKPVGMSQMHKEILNKTWSDITRYLKTKKVLQESEGIFSIEDRMQIKNAQDKADKNDMLTILLKKVPDKYDAFVDILEKGKQLCLTNKLLKAGRSDDFLFI